MYSCSNWNDVQGKFLQQLFLFQLLHALDIIALSYAKLFQYSDIVFLGRDVGEKSVHVSGLFQAEKALDAGIF